MKGLFVLSFYRWKFSCVEEIWMKFNELGVYVFMCVVSVVWELGLGRSNGGKYSWEKLGKDI